MMSIGWVGRTGWYFQSNIRRQKMSLSISGGSGGGLDLLKGLLASIKASQTASNQTSSSDTTKSTATTSKTNTTTTTDSGSQSDSNGLTAFSDALKNLHRRQAMAHHPHPLRTPYRASKIRATRSRIQRVQIRIRHPRYPPRRTAIGTTTMPIRRMTKILP